MKDIQEEIAKTPAIMSERRIVSWLQGIAGAAVLMLIVGAIDNRDDTRDHTLKIEQHDLELQLYRDELLVCKAFNQKFETDMAVMKATLENIKKSQEEIKTELKKKL